MSKTYKFIISDKIVNAHICDFEQGSDGSIYLKFADFEYSKWIYPDAIGSQLIAYDSPGSGKLSIHGSGLAHVKAYNNPRSVFRIPGSPLLSKDKTIAGIRHIATIFPSTPAIKYIGHDTSKSNLKPMVFVFFAIPFGLDVDFQGSFNIDEFEGIPPVQGFGHHPLRLHNIIWLSYRSKYMEHWPRTTHVHFSDGFNCPLFVGTNDNQIKIEFRMPSYQIIERRIEIRI